jgi:hypothetical protein
MEFQCKLAVNQHSQMNISKIRIRKIETWPETQGCWINGYLFRILERFICECFFLQLALTFHFHTPNNVKFP